jgi:hypothetical protein
MFTGVATVAVVDGRGASGAWGDLGAREQAQTMKSAAPSKPPTNLLTDLTWTVPRVPVTGGHGPHIAPGARYAVAKPNPSC